MKNTIRFLAIMLAVLVTGVLGGCVTQQQSESRTLYDFGSLPAAQNRSSLPALPPISVAEVGTPQWLDSRLMFYRLAYANDQQPRPYANSRWSMPPGQLFAHRLKAQIGQAGGAALSASSGVTNAPVLRIEADDFSQVFVSPQKSVARVSMRASVLNGRTLIAHKTFVHEAAAPTPDAAGGAKALAEASDAVIADMMTWLAGLPLKK